ncbi:PAS domain-containing sensor histidine kinase [Pseudomonas sp. BP8]|uniref:PAS domain-containing sensor histidine kinase n=1 Tax=Pseudomonas sp. BP8 TaxID=2817864 RepID=UPI001AEBA556|nr:PAS domain-containing sensor histidine kinase [Pseudomonas sp. BP8]MBP2262060.1 signal transduction histidine kinase [Pseudomonas sp. BP8]HDS1735443.1 PAS domain-containing protein [Pseudomonas putida]
MSTPETHELRQQLTALQRRNEQLEAQLAGSQLADAELYRFVFDNMELGCCIIELFDGPHGPLSDYRHVLTNAACFTQAGIDPLGCSARNLLTTEADHWISHYREVLLSGERIEFEQELRTTDRILALTSFRIEPAEKRLVVAMFKDITAQRRAESALLRLNQQLEQRSTTALAEGRLFAELIDHTIANVHVIDSNFRWLAINRQARVEFENLYGHRVKVGDFMPAAMSHHPLDSAFILPLWRRALSGETFTEAGPFGLNPPRYFELRFHPLRDQNGTVQGAYLFAYDISERVADQKRLREAEQALRQAQKMEAVGQLSGGIAHDFNNLLGGILGAHELIEQRLAQGRYEGLSRLLDTANGSAHRASALVHRLLAFSRKQTLQPQPTQVGILVDGMEQLILRSIGPTIELRSEFAAGIWPTFIDPPQLESALLNLCINARDALPMGGTIIIQGENVVFDTAQASALDLPPGEYMCLAVSDNGHGMSADVAQRAIDPFFTTKQLGKGTGLGLSMVYGFVRQSGGQLHIDSQPDQGTCVRLYLPRHLQAIVPRPSPIGTQASPVAHRAQRLIMLVEDQPTMQIVLREVLEELGHRVHAFDSGAAAVAALSEGVRPDLLISDIGLPGGLNGYQVAKTCLQLNPQALILYITGYDPTSLQTAGATGDAQFLVKPFELAVLVERVDQLLQA